MEMALYQPGLGYYTSETTEIGRSGDFYTSPHLHPVFGAMLGKQAEEFWEALGRPGRFDLVEYGAGRGWLAHDMLGYLKGKDIYGRLCYSIVELNPSMAGRQKALLSDYKDKVSWAGPSTLTGVTGAVLSNELLDAFPVHLVAMEGWLKEVYVDLQGGAFVEILGGLSTPEIEGYFEEFGVALANGQRAEVNLRMKPWLKEVGRTLREGFVLTIDYGYPAYELYAPERGRGTLLCYRGHRTSENPYEGVGLQDMTAHVNFSALKKWGEECGLRPLGFARQGVYLVSLGVDEVVTELYGGSPRYLDEVAKIKGLLMPGGMGESHKVMVQYKGEGGPVLRGFGMKNQAMSL
jgi:SAM-dependent MidA family methyltransferase